MIFILAFSTVRIKTRKGEIEENFEIHLSVLFLKSLIPKYNKITILNLLLLSA